MKCLTKSFVCTSIVLVQTAVVIYGDSKESRMIQNIKSIQNIQSMAPVPSIFDENSLEEWEPPEEMKEWFPYYVTGKDDDGSTVFVKEFGHWKFSELVKKKGKKSRILFDKYYEQYVHKIMKAGEENGATVIFDWDGFSLDNFHDNEALKLILRQLSTLESTSKVLKYTFMINTNFAAESLMNLARPMMGNVMEKAEIYGTQKEKWLPRLLKKLPRDVIPSRYFDSLKRN